MTPMLKVKSHFVPHNPRSQIHRRYNWRPDRPDARDLKFKVVNPTAPTITLPPSIDLKPYCSPVFNQGDMGSCTGNALAGAFEYMQLKEIRNKQTVGASAPEEFANAYTPASRLFIYWYERFLEGDPGVDAGASLQDGVKMLNTWGCCEEALWAYSDALVLQQPNAAAVAQAMKHKIGSYMRLETLDDMKSCLASGYPFVFGFTVYTSFESDAVAASGNVPMPSSTDQVLGGHAVMAVGYDEANQWFTIRNSWGTDWGINGYCHMPYSYLDPASGLASDWWTIRK
jgi:C1A family cysteine protease